MECGDVIFILFWYWYDYGSEGDGLMVWLDGLDLFVYCFFFVNFVENYEEVRYFSELFDNSNWKFFWVLV